VLGHFGYSGLDRGNSHGGWLVGWVVWGE
jgi:hypothetical protein